jgi:hypothetical protein
MFALQFIWKILCIGDKAERPRLTRRPKASIWLVPHHLRSLNTVNKGHNMKNMSIERIT